jgi:hypothetical protein
VRQTSIGVHAENATPWTPWLRSVVGLRADRFDFSFAQLDRGQRRRPEREHRVAETLAGLRAVGEDRVLRQSRPRLSPHELCNPGTVNPRVKLTVDVFNLFNRKGSDIDYCDASRLRGEPAEGVDDLHFHPVEPRSVRVSLIANF